MYNPLQDEPKTSEEYIQYIVCWLSGDSGWTEENVEELMREFKFAVLREARMGFGVYSTVGTYPPTLTGTTSDTY